MTPIREETETMGVNVQRNPLDLNPMEQEALRIQGVWEECSVDPYKASPQSMYDRYDVPVDHHEGDRATEIKLFSIQRPHMRGFHCAWISFFLAFTMWFAPAPLLKEIQDTLGLSKQQVWNSSITNDCTAIFMRVIMGPVCDSYGARMPMAIILVLASIPTACVGLVETATGLAVVRFFIGIAGSSFVMAQFWPSRMFSREIAGTANGLVGGWGNLGGAWTQLMMGTLLFPAFERYYDGDSERSWRTICVIPASVAFCFGLILPFISDDAPMGNYSEMKKSGTMDRIFFTTSLRQGATKNTWILFIQYASSFGVELVMNNAAVLYFTSEFGLDTKQASTLGFVYGSMNIFARGMGGYLSDKLNEKYGMRGRLWLQAFLLIMEGIMIIVFSFTDTLVGAVITMCVFSIFTQAAEGSIYGIVPYVSKLYTGAVSGFVGSGGNVGSVVYGLGFRSLPYSTAFLIMGCIVVASSFLSFFINIPCHAGLLWGEDNHAVISARARHQERISHSQHHRAQVAALDATAGAGDSVNVDDAASTQEMAEMGDRPKEEEAAPTDVDPESGIPVVPEVAGN
jgi:NNP family nitrate/nitrite transporter-like MFS transporter